MHTTKIINEGDKLLKDIEERGLIPSDDHPGSLEMRMEDTVKRLNMIRNCRKVMKVKVSPVQQESVPRIGIQ